MDSDEYFDRVVRFLETKGWNTSTTPVNESVSLVTGTRQSDTYYDRMMAMVGLGPKTTFGETHVRYLVDAAGDHDVDQLLVTTRGGFEDGTEDLLAEHGIDVVDPETIDDAFIDGFEVESDESLFDSASAGIGVGSESFRTTATALVGLYLVAAAVVGVSVLVLGFLSGATETLAAVLGTALVIVGPLVALFGTGILFTAAFPSPSPAGVFAGSVSGSLLFTVLVGGGGGAAGLTAATGLFDSAAALFAVLGLSVVAGLGAVGVASLYAALGTPLESS